MYSNLNTPVMSDQDLPSLKELAGSLPPLPEEMNVADVIKQAKLEHYLQSDR